MYKFILNMWIMGKIDEKKLDEYVLKGYITKEQAEEIKATPGVSA